MRDLRSELLPPKLDEDGVRRLTTLANQIINQLDTGRDPASAIEDFNQQVAQPVSASDFHGAAGSMDTEEFVRQIMTPAPGRIPDITRDELLAIITHIMNDDVAEHELQFWLDLLQANVPPPRRVRSDLPQRRSRADTNESSRRGAGSPRLGQATHGCKRSPLPPTRTIHPP